MKITRRFLIKTFAISSCFYLHRTFSKKSRVVIAPGDFRAVDSNLVVSGILVLESLDVTMKITKKTIYGDGHGHIVPISKSAWRLLLKDKSILIRSGLDSDENKHSHWIKVKISS